MGKRTVEVAIEALLCFVLIFQAFALTCQRGCAGSVAKGPLWVVPICLQGRVVGLGIAFAALYI